MDYDGMRFWFDVAQLIGTLLIAVYVWWSNREKVTAGRFLKLEKEVAERITSEALDKRCATHLERTARAESTITQIKAEVTHLPSHHDLEQLSLRIGTLGGQMERLSGRLEGINRAVDLVNEFLINQGGNRAGQIGGTGI